MPRIEHVALYADGDPGPLKDFYVAAFDFRVIVDNRQTDPPGYFLVGDDGTAALEIIGRPAGTTNADQRYVCHVAILVPDVDAKQAELETLGLLFEEGTAVRNAHMTTCFCRDPAGNRIQIVARVRPLGT